MNLRRSFTIAILLAFFASIAVSIAAPNAYAQGKVIAEGAKLFVKEGGQGGRAIVILQGGTAGIAAATTKQIVRAQPCVNQTCLTVPVLRLTQNIDQAAMRAAANADGATLMQKLGMDEVVELGEVRPTDVDGWIVATTRNGDLVYIDPTTTNGKSMEEILELAAEHALEPTGGVTRNGLAYYTNGINNTPAQHAETMSIIANSTGQKTIGVYNATEGGLKDAAQTGVDRLSALYWRLQTMLGGYRTGPIRNNPAVATVSQVNLVLGRTDYPVHGFFHSQGGVIGSRGVQRSVDALKAEGKSMDNFTITSMGSAAPVWVRDGVYGPSLLEHYVHVGDLTPRSLGLGGSARSLFGADFFQTGGPPNAIIHRFAGEAPEFVPAQGRLRDWFQLGNQRVRVTANHDVNNTYLSYYQALNPRGVPTLSNPNVVSVTGDVGKLSGLSPEAGITLDASQVASITPVAGRQQIVLTNGQVIYADRVVPTAPN